MKAKAYMEVYAMIFAKQTILLNELSTWYNNCQVMSIFKLFVKEQNGFKINL